MCHCYWFRSVLVGTAGIFHTGMKTGTIIPLIPHRIKFRPISECSSHSGQFQLKYIFRPVLDFGFKKNITSSFFFFFFFFFFLFFLFFFSSYFLLLLVGFNPSSSFFSSSVFRSCQSPFCFFFCVVQVNGDVFDWLLASFLFLKCYVLCFKFFVCFASPHDTLLSCHLCFKIWIFSLLCFCEPHKTNNKNRMLQP